MRVLGIVPARAGSKSIPYKNTALLCGRPLIEYTFDAALESKLLTRLVVSTDCERVKELADARGIEVIHRPAELAQDDTPMVPVLQHALSVSGEPYDAVMCLSPTCPMRTSQDIDDSIRLIATYRRSSIISYAKVDANHPARMVTLEEWEPRPLSDQSTWNRKQDLPFVYIRSGDIYLTRTEWINKGELVGDRPRAYIIPPERHCNIDRERDLKWAEFLMSQMEAVV